MLSDSDKQQLDTDGFLALPGFLSPQALHQFRTKVAELFALEGDNAGGEFRQEPGTQRLANCVNKGEIFERVIATPEILECMAHVLGPEFKLSSVNVRSANPHSACGQPLHADSGAIPDARGYWVCNSVWMLDDFTPDNGSLRVAPGSHRWGRLPQPGEVAPDERLVTGKAGTVVVMNAHMWHGGTDNHTDVPRCAMHVYYTRRDKPQQQYQKQLLSPEVQARATPQVRWLLALDDAENDRLSVQSGVSGFLR
ncbi:MAG TPA: phytanoyl-CoA dioxygenase [Solibacterales bacterium]|nr:phytanoyl-CoA dioxygenase [Bryobacterales bacterium]